MNLKLIEKPNDQNRTIQVESKSKRALKTYNGHVNGSLAQSLLKPAEKQRKIQQWKVLLRQSIETPEEVSDIWGENLEVLKALNEDFHIRINPYFASLIHTKHDPIYKQVVPDSKELQKGLNISDPLNEEAVSPIASITHRYADRVLFLVTHQCAVYCRFCTRRRKVSDLRKLSEKFIDEGIEYIESHPEIRDVILSGGDPLMLDDHKLAYILERLSKIKHIDFVRIGTKMPCVLPQRITPQLCEILKAYQPIYISTHFNHPREMTPEAKKACHMLADSGAPLGNQTVLLKDINDDLETLLTLMRELLKARVKPYYLYQADLTAGTEHFRTRVEKGIELIEGMRGKISGMGLPQFVIDAPNGGGKIPVSSQSIITMTRDEVIIKGLDGLMYRYPQVRV